MFARARYLSKIGDFEAAWEAYDAIMVKDKTVTGKKIDATMEKARIALFTLDTDKLKVCVNEAKSLNETGGDWDRRNRLKIYEAYYLMAIRDLKGAAKLLMDCIATFTCVELCSYKQFMYYTMLTSIITLDRNDLRKKIIDDPHVITTSRELPEAQKLIVSIYRCEYQTFFEAVRTSLVFDYDSTVIYI
jgi:26S proteasome regulatory subunit N7